MNTFLFRLKATWLGKKDHELGGPWKLLSSLMMGKPVIIQMTSGVSENVDICTLSH